MCKLPFKFTKEIRLGFEIVYRRNVTQIRNIKHTRKCWTHVWCCSNIKRKRTVNSAIKTFKFILELVIKLIEKWSTKKCSPYYWASPDSRHFIYMLIISVKILWNFLFLFFSLTQIIGLRHSLHTLIYLLVKFNMPCVFWFFLPLDCFIIMLIYNLSLKLRLYPGYYWTCINFTENNTFKGKQML